jgi:hypothetical protein
MDEMSLRQPKEMNKGTNDRTNKGKVKATVACFPCSFFIRSFVHFFISLAIRDSATSTGA